MKKIALVGLIYDTNLGDPAIYETTKKIVLDHIDCEIINIDLYGRDGFHVQENTPQNRIFNRIKYIIRNKEERIIKILKKEINTKLDNSVSAVIFVGGGLIKYKHQFIAQPIELIIDRCEKLNIPVMLSAVGVEGYDLSDDCQKLKKHLNYSCVKCITTRDDIVTLQNKYIESNIKIYKVADPAISISRIYKPTQRIKNRVGLGIGRRGLFSDYENNISDDYIKRLWINTYKILKDKGYNPVFFTNGLSADNAFAREIAEYVGVKDVIEPSCLDELCQVISSFEFAIVTRLHSSIICYSYGVPTLNLVWNNKQIMFGEATNRSRCFMTPNDFNKNFELQLQEISTEKILIQEDFIESTAIRIKEFINSWVDN